MQDRTSADEHRVFCRQWFTHLRFLALSIPSFPGPRIKIIHPEVDNAHEPTLVFQAQWQLRTDSARGRGKHCTSLWNPPCKRCFFGHRGYEPH